MNFYSNPYPALSQNALPSSQCTLPHIEKLLCSVSQAQNNIRESLSFIIIYDATVSFACSYTILLASILTPFYFYSHYNSLSLNSFLIHQPCQEEGSQPQHLLHLANIFPYLAHGRLKLPFFIYKLQESQTVELKNSTVVCLCSPQWKLALTATVLEDGTFAGQLH